MIPNIPKHYRHFKRYRKIAEVLLKNGFGVIVENLDLIKFLPFKKRFKKGQDKLNRKTRAIRLRMVLQDLGPTYIKLGQLLSTRADILPPHYIKELRKLQDDVDAVPFYEIENVLINELGSNYMDDFLSVKKDPQATASIAQVHQAVLSNGEEVILKIQRPKIDKIIDVDFEILRNIVSIAVEKGIIPEFLKPEKILEEFRLSLKKELDFKREAANINKFTNNFNNEKRIIAPRVYEDVSTRKLLVLEEIKGIKLSEIDEPQNINLDLTELAAIGAKSFMKQVLIDGFFHADPHPGNIFLVNKNCLAYIDFGLMGQLTEEDKDKLSVLFIAVLKQDVNIISDLILELGDFEEELDQRKFKLEVQDLLNRYYGIELRNINFMTVIDDIERLLFNFHIRMPEEFFLLFRAIGLNEGVGYLLDPSFNIIDVANDFSRELIKNKLKADHIFERMLHKFWDYRSMTKGLPRKFVKLLNDIINDEFTIQFKHINLEQLMNKIDIVSNRLSISLIISALIIGSSMVLQIDMQPDFYGFPLLGFLGFSIAGIMGLWLVISIFRSGKF
ncbi:ABC1 kinase family protein [Natronospora cellulosivora (SeqCode)]